MTSSFTTTFFINAILFVILLIGIIFVVAAVLCIIEEARLRKRSYTVRFKLAEKLLDTMSHDELLKMFSDVDVPENYTLC